MTKTNKQTIAGFGKSKKKKGKKKTSKNDDPKDQENGGKGEEKGFAWTAEAEAPLVYWWETDDASRVPWGIARLLGLVLRCCTSLAYVVPGMSQQCS